MLLFFGDVDKLKTINDTLGHAQGDLALKEISIILKKSFREADILARFGGDEFVALVLDATQENAHVLINRIQAALKLRNDQKEKTNQLNLSLGHARYNPKSPSTLNDLITKADGLMYEQKLEKRNKVS